MSCMLGNKKSWRVQGPGNQMKEAFEEVGDSPTVLKMKIEN